MKKTVTTVDGVKITVLPYREPKSSARTWNPCTGHTISYVGLGGRGLRKGWSTKSFQV